MHIGYGLFERPNFRVPQRLDKMVRIDGFGIYSEAGIIANRSAGETYSGSDDETLARMTPLTVVVTLDGGRIKFKFPFDPPSVVCEGNS